MQVLTDEESGLRIKVQQDKKTIYVDASASSPGSDTVRITLVDPRYLQAILFVHEMRYH